MIDAFALLDQPRKPWLDSEEIKQAFHQKARRAHPDAQSTSGDPDAFSALNEAHQILQDPKRRLEHLLRLLGNSPERQASEVPPVIEALFPSVASITQDANAIVERSQTTTTTLGKSLLKRQVAELTERLEAMSARVEELQLNAVRRLRELDADWPNQVPELHEIYRQLSYLTRWTAELDEKRAQVSMC